MGHGSFADTRDLSLDDRARTRRPIDPVAKVVRVEALTNHNFHDALGRIRLPGEKLFLVFAVLRARLVLLASAHGHVAVACRAVVRAG